MDTTLDVYSTIPLPLALGDGHSITALYATSPMSDAETAALGAHGGVMTEVVIDGGSPLNRVLRMPLVLEGDIAAQVTAAL